MTSLRTVDSWMQMVDRLIICRLKEYHYRKDGRAEDAIYAKEQAEELSEMATRYLEECLSGDREPRVHRHLRYHQHETEGIKVSSVVDVVSQLAECHAEYWQHQGEVLRLRKQAADAVKEQSFGGVSWPEFMCGIYKSLDKEQRLIDGCNQLRSELVQKGDDLLFRMCEKRKQDGRP